MSALEKAITAKWRSRLANDVYREVAKEHAFARVTQFRAEYGEKGDHVGTHVLEAATVFLAWKVPDGREFYSEMDAYKVAINLPKNEKIRTNDNFRWIVRLFADDLLEAYRTVGYSFFMEEAPA